MKYEKIGLIGRFRPLHLGSAKLLEAACENSSKVIIGIGSSNRYDFRNPFTADEVEQMIRLFLKKFNNYEIKKIPDSGHIPEFSNGEKWKQYVLDQFGKLDFFVTGNEYVRELLKNDYKIMHSADLISKENHIRLSGSQVRLEIARYGNWKSLVPEVVADYLETSGLVSRFQREFGLQTLALLTKEDFTEADNLDKEIKNVRGLR